MWFPICLHCCGSLLRFQANLPSCDQPLCDSRVCGRTSLKRNVLRTNRAQKKVKKKPQQRNAHSWAGGFRERHSCGISCRVCAVRDEEALQYTRPGVQGCSLSTSYFNVVLYMNGGMRHTSRVSVGICVCSLHCNLFLDSQGLRFFFLCTVGVGITACEHVSPWLCVFAALCPLMSYWHIGRRILLKNKTTGWVSQFNTSRHTHAHTTSSLFKRQTRAVLLSHSVKMASFLFN